MTEGRKDKLEQAKNALGQALRLIDEAMELCRQELIETDPGLLKKETDHLDWCAARIITLQEKLTGGLTKIRLDYAVERAKELLQGNKEKDNNGTSI